MNRLFSNPSPSKKGFIVVNYIYTKINSNKIPKAYFKPWECDYLLLPKCDCLGVRRGPRCDCLIYIYIFYVLFFSLIPNTVINTFRAHQEFN
jgi:hypothetical protein